MSTIRVILADDYPIVRQGLKIVLEREGIEVVAETGDGAEAVRLTRRLRPDVAVLDVAMPGLSGLDAAREIARTSRGTETIILTQHEDRPYIMEAIRIGVRGYVLKSQAVGDLVQAIRDALRGALFLSPRIAQAAILAAREGDDPPKWRLAPREREVLRLIAEGGSTRQIARMLEIGPRTVETYRRRLMGKLRVHDVAGLVRCAVRLRLIAP